MRGISIAALALLIAGPALGADVRAKRAETSAPIPTPTYSAPEDTRPWQGPYIGVGVGYGWQDWSREGSAGTAAIPGTPAVAAVPPSCSNPDMDHGGWNGTAADCRSGYNAGAAPIPAVQGTPAVPGTPAASGTEEGFFVTGRVGYDFQHSPLVFGPFAELNYSMNDDSAAEWSGAIGGRLGFLIDPRVLAYVNGGIEITDYDNISGETEYNGFAGGGLEFLLNGGWSLSGEGRVSFVEETISGTEIDNLYTVRAIFAKRF